MLTKPPNKSLQPTAHSSLRSSPAAAELNRWAALTMHGRTLLAFLVPTLLGLSFVDEEFGPNVTVKLPSESSIVFSTYILPTSEGRYFGADYMQASTPPNLEQGCADLAFAYNALFEIAQSLKATAASLVMCTPDLHCVMARWSKLNPSSSPDSCWLDNEAVQPNHSVQPTPFHGAADLHRWAS